MNLRIALATAALGIVLAATATAAQCPGDCRNDGEVTIDELLMLVNIAFDNGLLSNCQSGDANGDDSVTVDEIIAAVNRALRGCIPDVTGTWQQDQAAITSSTCASAITSIVQEGIAAGDTDCTFQIEQTGTHLSITSMCPGETNTFDGTVDANGLLTVTSSEQDSMDGCSFALTENTSGMVTTSPTVGTQVMDFTFSPRCGFANCRIVVQAHWTKLT